MFWGEDAAHLHACRELVAYNSYANNELKPNTCTMPQRYHGTHADHDVVPNLCFYCSLVCLALASASEILQVQAVLVSLVWCHVSSVPPIHHIACNPPCWHAVVDVAWLW